MNLLLRERWPLVAGAFAGVLVLVLFAATGLGDRLAERDGQLLAVPAAGWAVALLVVALSLSMQLVLHQRMSIVRERRLVENAAELLETTARLEALATTDSLTGLLNRRAFYERFGVEFRRSVRYSRPLSLLMMDLDDFKRVNDTYGHPFGDFVLVEMAETFRSSLRESDIVAKYGGEEFVVMLPDTDQDAAMLVAEKLRAAVDARVLSRDGITERMTISIGVSALPGAGLRDEDDLVSRADQALYQAKREGKARVIAASEPAPADTTPPER